MADNETRRDERPWYEVVVLPALLRHARQTYGGAMRRALVAEGFDDVPGNGLYVLGAMVDSSAPFTQIIEEAAGSKLQGERLVDVLIQRGYLARSSADDRSANLTDRGRAAAAVMATGRDRIDAELTARVGPEYIEHTRRTLAALIGLNPDRQG